MRILLLTGPPAAGKNSVAAQLAKKREHCAVIDADSVRQMIIQPRLEPWEGTDGPIQYQMGIDNSCALARNFVASGYDVVITDAITDEMLKRYRQLLGDLDIWTVQLLPTEEEVSARLLSLPDYLIRGEVTWLYEQQAALEEYDERIDNTSLSTETVVDWLLNHWPAFA